MVLGPKGVLTHRLRAAGLELRTLWCLLEQNKHSFSVCWAWFKFDYSSHCVLLITRSISPFQDKSACMLIFGWGKGQKVHKAEEEFPVNTTGHKQSSLHFLLILYDGSNIVCVVLWLDFYLMPFSITPHALVNNIVNSWKTIHFVYCF